MAYYKNWRKRTAEVLALAEDSSSEDADQMLLAQSSDDEAASFSNSAEDNIVDYDCYDSDAIPVSSDSDTTTEDFYTAEGDSDGETVPDLSGEVAAWATSNGCKRSTVNEILGIMRRQGLRLPKDARTLLKTPKKVATTEKCGGHYAYFGIASGILKILAQNPGYREDSVDISLNIDGVPLFKSSNLQMWPILCNFHNFPPFIIALYCGDMKPNSDEEYLCDLIKELQQLQEDGIVHGEKTLPLTVKSFICDAPARAFLKCTKNRNAYFSCERCTIRGTYDGRVVLGATEPTAVERDEDKFSQVGYKDHQVGKSPLIAAGIPCVRGFALDYMDLVCLGVVRRMLHWMKEGPQTCRLSYRQRSEISEHLQTLNGKLPSEFARQPRSILELDRWKATELRQFLLYTGPLVLRKVISGTVYRHFLRLMVAMIFLLNADDQERNNLLGYVRELILSFVREV